eukprot:scaffold91395_cov90-Phaeocystis_antarctica.AAC.2
MNQDCRIARADSIAAKVGCTQINLGRPCFQTITPPAPRRGDVLSFVARRTNVQRAPVQFFERHCIVVRCVCGALRGGVGVAHAHQASTAVRLKFVWLWPSPYAVCPTAVLCSTL